MYDIIIIGAGPAGLTAGIYAGRAGLSALILDKGQSGGTANTAPLVENYPGYDKIPGMDLMKNVSEQTKKYCEIIEFVTVKNIEKMEECFEVESSKGNFTSKLVLLATGSTHQTLDVPGVEEYTGRGISYCAVCDGFLYRNKVICVVGGGDSAIKSAIHLSKFAKEVHILVRRDKLRANNKSIELLNNCNNIVFHYNSTITKIIGNDFVEGINFIKNNNENTIKLDGIFVTIGSKPNSEIFEKYITLDKDGYIITDNNCETNIKGVFAAGDIQSNTYKQAIIAAGNGYNAATNAYYFLKK